MRSSADFEATVRRGRRIGRPTVVLHYRPGDASSDPAVRPSNPARIGFVVSRAVGGAVVRNRVKRRLRHLLAARLDLLGAGARLVVRALPAAGTDAARVEADVDSALATAGAS